VVATAKGTLIGLTAPTPIGGAATAASTRDTLPPIEPASQAPTAPGGSAMTGSAAQFASGERMRSGPVSEEDEPNVCQVGQRFGDVVITRLVTRGGMGEVYEAFHEHMEQRLALKVLRPRYRKRPDFVERFRDEGKLLAAFCQKEPNVVQIRNVGFDERVGPYITMEWLVGRNLRELQGEWQGKLPLGQAVAHMITVADVTHRVHRLGLIHRDLKPENLFLEVAPRDVPGAETRLVLLDLGIAKRAGGERTTDENRTLGTIEYMAPEQIQSGTATARSDQYAIGHMLHEMIAGEHAFAAQMRAALDDGGAERRQLVVMAAHLFQDTPPLDAAQAPTVKLPDGSTLSLAAIAQRAMRREPADRYPSMEAFASDLRAWLSAYRGGGAENPTSSALGYHILDGTPPPPRANSAEISTHRTPQHAGSSATAQSPAGWAPAGSAPAGSAPAGLTTASPVGAGRGKNQPTLVPQSMRTDKTSGAIDSVAQTDFVAAYSLVVVSSQTGEAIARYPLLRAVIVIGRGEDECDIILAEPTVSRVHCELRHVSPGVFQAVDLGSTHGLLVRGIQTRSALLRTNDRLSLGHVEMRVCPPGCFRRVAHGGWSFVPSLFELPPEERATVRMIGNAATPQGPVLDAEKVLARAMPRTLHDPSLSGRAGPGGRARRDGGPPSFAPSSIDARRGASVIRTAIYVFILTLLLGVGGLALARLTGFMPDTFGPSAPAAPAPPPAENGDAR
jgi:serine/threonine protein kinase